MKKINLLLLTFAILLSFVSCKSEEPITLENTEVPSGDSTVTHTGTIVIKDIGEMKFELYGEIAPITVENFISLVADGFYEGITFHRVIENFMIQGGDPSGDGTGGSKETIKGEFTSNGFENPILHEKGVLSMARTMDPDSASSQFFIMHAATPSLDGEYAAFGRITEGLEIIDDIATVETDSSDKPITPVVIENITID